MTKNKPIYHVDRGKGEVSPSPYIGLLSERDKLVYFYFFVVGGYFPYNAIIVRDN